MEPIDNKEFLLNSARALFDSAQFSAAQAIAPPHKLNPAQWAYERIKSLIYDFERSLSPEEEVGCRLVSFGNTSVYYIDIAAGLSFKEPPAVSVISHMSAAFALSISNCVAR